MKIYGASDDIVCVDHDGEHHEIDCFDEDVAFNIGGVAVVVMSYALCAGPVTKGPVWHASIMQVDEGDEFPFDIRVTADGGYSVTVRIEGSPEYDYEKASR